MRNCPILNLVVSFQRFESLHYKKGQQTLFFQNAQNNRFILKTGLFQNNYKNIIQLEIVYTI